VCRRWSGPLSPWPRPVVAATLAYPPLGYLVLDGQLSMLAAAALALALSALVRQSKVMAGLAIGLLGYKVSLFVPAVAVCLLAGEWTIAAAALAVAALQLGIVTPIVGVDVIRAYVVNTVDLMRSPDALARSPHLMASWRTFWSELLPPESARMAYLVSATATVALAAREWRRGAPPLKRIAMLALAIVLSAPHLYFYDLVILVPAFMNAAGTLVARRALTLRWCTWLSYFAACGAPLAGVTHVQPATLLLSAWMIALAGAAPDALLSAGGRPNDDTTRL
jgi:hypothetical protein